MRIRNYLMMLPEPYRSRAFEYAMDKKRINLTSDSLEDALSRSFTFKETKEGSVYWGRVYGLCKYYRFFYRLKIFKPILLYYNFTNTSISRNYVINHLYALPEPFKSKALTNYKKYNGEDFYGENSRYKKTANGLRDALGIAFDWENTPEGEMYWRNLKNSIINR